MLGSSILDFLNLISKLINIFLMLKI